MNGSETDTDLTFFTNQEHSSLLDRFVSTLPDARTFDVLVGYFRLSGFHRLYEHLESVEEIHILVGINVGQKTFEHYQSAQRKLDMENFTQAEEQYLQQVQQELELSEDAPEVETGIRTFINWLQSGKLKLRVYPSEDIHAKVYISRFSEADRDYGRVITGSSNFSESGLVGRREFNVELKNREDVRFAEDQFEQLWKESTEITEKFVEQIPRKTWLNDEITPYELYLKFLYEYFEEEINLDRDFDDYLPPGYIDLEYQKQAVAQAQRILNEYGGVFIADVVGLGKTFIAALLAQKMKGQKLILCPPVLEDYWEDTFREFGVRGYKVQSHGKLHHVLRNNPDKYSTILVDEAHRFRNEQTEKYEKLLEICWGKDVILVTATPFNNTEQDIYRQLKLFQEPKQSTIPGVKNLHKFFKGLEKRKRNYDPDDPGYQDVLDEVAEEVREKILKYVMIRRTRSDVEKHYKEDLEKRGVQFPEVKPPHRLLYNFDSGTEEVFEETIQLLKEMDYARYVPLLYLEEPVEEFEKQSQRNIRGFMKSLIVKRLESSFLAFKNTLGRFIESYENFVDMYESGAVYVSKDVNINELWDSAEADNEARLLELVEEDKAKRWAAEKFSDNFIADINKDLQLLRKIKHLWNNVTTDPKLESLLEEIESNELFSKSPAVIFTESAETGEYLYEELNERYPDRVMFYSSSRRLYQGATVGKRVARDRIRENFDPGIEPENGADEIRFLVTTDVLSEGINLHQSNLIVNYDLPWNPTKVLQRSGRVNRIGTPFEEIHIFNFFPTSQAEEHLNLEAIVTSKLQSFHDILGEDAKYLTEAEEVTTHSFFGEQLYEKLNDPETYEKGGDQASPELDYLAKIREVRDQNPELFDRLKKLPKKARTAREITGDNSASGLLSFFRKGNVKSFYLCEEDGAQALPFYRAATLMECEQGTERLDLPDDYYSKLNQNKQQFKELFQEEVEHSRQGGQTNEQFIVQYLQAVENHDKFTESDQQYIRSVIDLVQGARPARQTTRKIKQKLESLDNPTGNPLKILEVLRCHIPDGLLEKESPGSSREDQPREIILSEYLVNAENSGQRGAD